MTVDKLGRLIDALGGSQAQQKPQKAETSPQVENRVSERNTEAVRLADDFGGRELQAVEEDRGQRLAEIKAQVDSGSYKQDSAAVAEKLFLELA